MRQLRPSELHSIITALARLREQEAKAEEARLAIEQQRFATLLAAIINAGNRVAGVFSRRRPRLVKPEALLGSDFKRRLRDLLQGDDEPDWSAHIEDAKAKDLKGPWSS